MPIIKKIEFINKKNYVIAELNADSKSFLVYIDALNTKIPHIYLSQIAEIRLLKINKASITILAKYINYINLFLPKLIAKFQKHTGINNHIIK